MGRWATAFLAGAALVLAASARAGEAAGGPVDNPYDRRRALLRDLRPGVVLLRTETGPASGTVLDREAGLVACAKASLGSAGEIRVYAFRTEVPERGPDVVRREDLGRARVAAIHREADAALLRLDIPPGLEPFAFRRGGLRAGVEVEVTVVGVRGAAPFDDADDLDVRRGRTGGEGDTLRVPLTAPTHRSSAGGAVLSGDRALVGVASFDLCEGLPGAAVPIERFLELRDGLQNPQSTAKGGLAMPADEAVDFVKAKGGRPPFWPVSPGGPSGKRVDFGPGAAAVKEPRAVVATGVFVLDREQALEYLATPLERGKLHETVIATDADPAVLNFAFVALKYRSGGWIPRGEEEPSKPYGGRMRIYVEWDAAEAQAIREWLSKIDPPWERPGFREVRERVGEGAIRWEPGETVRVRAEELLFNVREGRPMVLTDWLYTGSGFIKDEETGRHSFRATLDGVFVAVYNDPAAMFNIPLEAGQDDTYYCVRGNFNPPRGTRCTMIFLPAEGHSDSTATRP